PSPSYSASVAASRAAATGASARLITSEAYEEYCVGLLLEQPATWSEVYGILGEGDFAGTETRALFSALLRAHRSDPALDMRVFLQALPMPLQSAATRARTRATELELEEGDVLTKAISRVAFVIKRMRLKEEMAELDYLEREATGAGDLDAARGLLRRSQELHLQRRALDAASGLQG
ncbi:MAG: hypothetical protein ACHQ4H_16680, partial [Ktedonobacterales bacterium]